MAMTVLATTRWFGLALVAMFLGGVFWIWMFIATNAAIQLGSPPQLLGRMLGFGVVEVKGTGSSLAPITTISDPLNVPGPTRPSK